MFGNNMLQCFMCASTVTSSDMFVPNNCKKACKRNLVKFVNGRLPEVLAIVGEVFVFSGFERAHRY